MPNRSDYDRNRSRRSSSRSSYGRAGSSRSSNRYPQFDYDLDTRTPSRSTRSSSGRRPSNRRRPYQKRSWTIGTWRFTGRTVSILICFVFVVVFLLLCKAFIKGNKNKPDREASAPESQASEEIVPVDGSELSILPTSSEEPVEPEKPKPTNWEGMADLGDRTIEITSYYTYGSHLFFSGATDIMPQVVNMQLVLRPVHEAIDLATWDMVWYEDGSQTQYLSAPTITEGPCLEVIPVGQYALLVKLTADTGDVSYVPIRDASGSDAIEYYTITRNGKNNRVMIDTLTDEKHGTSFWGLDIQEAELPEDVYDFVLDPGHGGNDGGCTDPDEKYTERDTVMQVCQRAYDILTGEGYKVLMTRDGTEGDDRWMAYEFFDNPGGRVTVCYQARAKYCISVHINTVDNPDVHGFQVFGTVRGNHVFGKLIGQAMEENTNVEPSSSTWNLQAPGVFFRTLDDLYHEGLFNNKDSLVMIRELGGVATGAFESGGGGQSENIYRNSIQTIESDLLEIGFFSNAGDCKEMIENNADFADAIVASYHKLFDTFTMLDPSTAPAAETSAGSTNAESSVEDSSEESSEDSTDSE